jgi:hypothetical protein
MVFLANFQNTATSAVFPHLAESLGVSINKVSYLISFNVLFLGIGVCVCFPRPPFQGLWLTETESLLDPTVAKDWQAPSDCLVFNYQLFRK